MTGAQGRPWIGFRVDAEPLLESTLTDGAAPRLESLRREGVIRRWFFLWYSESGVHLRLRLQPARGRDTERVAEEVARLVSDVDTSVRVQRQVYDRATLDSVLAELLHVSTSRLALDFLSQVPRERSNVLRWLIAVAAAAAFARRAITAQELDAALVDWLRFAARAAEQRGLRLEDLALAASPHRRLAALEGVLPRVERALDRHPAARRAVALLRRARARGEFGRFVATHALHLFCNEMGFGFDREYDIVASVRAACSPGHRPHRVAELGVLAATER
jgi:thiopeptide-type bacteriocin biosynthesis protein